MMGCGGMMRRSHVVNGRGVMRGCGVATTMMAAAAVTAPGLRDSRRHHGHDRQNECRCPDGLPGQADERSLGVSPGSVCPSEGLNPGR
jgi:hypothetical protein